MGFQNESIESMLARYTPVTYEDIQNIRTKQPMENGRENIQEIDDRTRESGLPSDVLNNLKEAEEESNVSTEINPETLRRIKEVQEEKSGGIIREVMETVKDVTEDIVDGIKDIFDGPDDKTETASEFDKAEFQESVDAASREWHVQIEGYSCAIACQQFIINEFKDANVSEQELIDLSLEQGWYQEHGTAYADIGNLLKMYDIDTTVKMTGDFQDLLEASNNGDRVIVSVQNTALATEWCDNYPYGSANHAVEVVGIDQSDPENLKVIVNDPGVEDGCAKVISYENFMDAWSTSGGYMLTAHRN